MGTDPFFMVAFHARITVTRTVHARNYLVFRHLVMAVIRVSVGGLRYFGDIVDVFSAEVRNFGERVSRK